MLTLPNGDYIDGQFNGSLTEGVKVNGTFYKSSSNYAGEVQGIQDKLQKYDTHISLFIT